MAQRTDQISERFRCHDRRGAAPEVDMSDRLPSAKGFCNEVSFGPQSRCIERDRLLALRDRSVAATIPARASTKRHVHVDRCGLLRAQRLEPHLIVGFANRS